jgi:6-pyruvoyltetrahydropterin/6-carboxytetrahydropterin synthase
MYELMVKDTFAAAHNLRDYKGKCERVHGHNYTVMAYFETAVLGKNGLSVDFTILKKYLRKITDTLDHRNLNSDIAFFEKNNTSTENIAAYIYHELKKKVKNAAVKKVAVFESENSMAAYYE